ncbi:GNAT family N-acetyltransferase [Acetobacteraceae bacterium H6797]|nr:GNAT family N-acetyltransferase [Acetobacteraceae bacterium H6797]
MSPFRGRRPHDFARLKRQTLGLLHSLDLDPDQVERYFDPLPKIMGAVLKGPSHAAFISREGNRSRAFYVLHQDRRDAACWWIGWLAVSRGHQGQGLGRLAMMDALRRLSAIPGCRRVRLFVVPENKGALSLYRRLGFETIGYSEEAECLIMELVLSEGWSAPWTDIAHGAAQPRRERRRLRLRLLSGPHVVPMVGVERGPPAASPP